MHLTTTRRGIASVAATLATGIALLATAASAQALPRHSLGNTECSMVEHTGYGVGLPTYLPQVYAADATRYRDLQWVDVRTDVYELQGSNWVQIIEGDTYQGLAADDNAVQSFQNLRTGARSLLYQRLQFILYRNGGYRVAQSIRWHRNGAVPADSTYRWVNHYPGMQNSSWCLIR
jgi:hypothetical protein